MYKSVIVLVTFITFISCASQDHGRQISLKIHGIEHGLIRYGANSLDQSLIEKPNSLLERMNYYKVPGVSIAIINDNQIEWAKGYGIINADNDFLVTADSLFQAASATKVIIAAIALHLVEKGLLNLDEDVNARLRTWQIPTISFNKNQKVTLRHLLTHQSGLPATNFPYEPGKIPTLIQVLKGEAPAQNQAAVVGDIPGSRWQYSNIGYVVIQLLLEDVLGNSLPLIAQEIIFKPLHMQSSYFLYPLNRELSKNEAVPHDTEGKPQEASLHPTAMAQGGLITTPSDLARFTIELMRAYQGKSDLILSQEMAHQMFHPELDLDPEIFGGAQIKEGLGVFLRVKEPNLSFNHPGDNFPGASCWITGFPGSGKGAIIMTNGANGLYYLTLEILAAIRKEYDWPLDW